MNIDKITQNTNLHVSRTKEATGRLGDRDTIDFRGVSQTERDVQIEVTYNQMALYCYRSWIKNPITYSAIETTIDYVLGDNGIIYKAKDERVQEVLDEFYRINQIGRKCKKRLRDKMLNGELLMQANITKLTGRVLLGWIDPRSLIDFRYNKLNREDIAAVKFQTNGKWYEVIREDILTKLMKGDIFYHQINRTGGQSRGMSSLFQARDWLRKYEDMTDSLQKYSEAQTRLVWDVTIQNADSNQLKVKNSNMIKQPPQKQGWVVHNEKETWELKHANINGGSFNELNKIFLGNAITGFRMPIHMFGRGDDANRATALAQNSPYYRMVRSLQTEEKDMYRDWGSYAIQMAKAFGSLSQDIDDSFVVAIPEPDKELLIKLAGIFEQLGNGLGILKMENLISDNVAQSISDMLMEQTGIEIGDEDDPNDNQRQELNPNNKKVYNMIKKHLDAERTRTEKEKDKINNEAKEKANV